MTTVRPPRVRADDGTSWTVIGVMLAAVVAISSSAVLVRWADASAVALAFWRTLGGAVILVVLDRATLIARRRWPSASISMTLAVADGEQRPTGREWRLIVVAGLALAVHFSTWLASLELTSVAASVTLVSTAPLMIAVYHGFRGRSPGRWTWLAIGLATAGTLIIAGGDRGSTSLDTTSAEGAELAASLGLSPAVFGDILALTGAAAVAVYLVAGASVRDRLSTAAYAWRAYAVAAAGLALWSVASGVQLVGFDRTTWLAIAGIILGPQMMGHTGLNHLLRRLGSVTVSLALLVEPLTASVLVWAIFTEVPPMGAFIGGPIVVGAIALHLLKSR
jgi:drug/metabolite transporter (DMT)-like permease